MEPTLYPDWHDQVVYSREGPQPVVLAETEDFKVVLGGLEPGGKIPIHPEGAAVYHFLEGSGWMFVDDERFPVQTGATVITPAGSKRGMEAQTRLAFIAARVPDHSRT